MKSELKIDYKNSEILKEVIEKTYFEYGQLGKIMGRKIPLTITPSDDILFTILSGLDRSTIKIQNDDIIDGYFRLFVEEESDNIKLYPISTYCIPTEDGRYSFY